MTPAAFGVRAGQSADGVRGCASEAHTLAGEHALLMRDVRRRTEPVTALLDARVWPDAEVATLTTFLRAAVLRQVSDEEALLFPGDPSAAPFAELSADHVRLHTLVAQLDATRAEPCPLPELRALVEDLLATLDRHLSTEQAVLAALSEADTEVPSAADLVADDQPWPHAAPGPVRITLDTLPAEQAARLCVERLLRLRPGEVAEIRSRDRWRIRKVSRWLRRFDPARFWLGDPPAGDGHTVLQVTCRPAD